MTGVQVFGLVVVIVAFAIWWGAHHAARVTKLEQKVFGGGSTPTETPVKPK